MKQLSSGSGRARCYHEEQGVSYMFEANTHDPELFIASLQQYHDAQGPEKGELADTLSELIVRKRVDLAQVRLRLLDAGEALLIDTLDRLIDLIEPYLEEGGVDE